MILRFRGIILALETGPERDPNRIFDAGAFRKPLESLLKRSWRLLKPKKGANEPLLAALGRLLEGS